MQFIHIYFWDSVIWHVFPYLHLRLEQVTPLRSQSLLLAD